MQIGKLNDSHGQSLAKTAAAAANIQGAGERSNGRGTPDAGRPVSSLDEATHARRGRRSLPGIVIADRPPGAPGTEPGALGLASVAEPGVVVETPRPTAQHRTGRRRRAASELCERPVTGWAVSLSLPYGAASTRRRGEPANVRAMARKGLAACLPAACRGPRQLAGTARQAISQASSKLNRGPRGWRAAGLPMPRLQRKLAW